jgi:suppressor of ftsI/bilirubin oxidase
VAPGETVEIAVDMSHGFNEEQVYLLHCHILEHHDAGMMVNYRVSA